MGVLQDLNIKPGVIYGDDVLNLFNYAKEKGFAIPAINVVRTRALSSVPEPHCLGSSPSLQARSRACAIYTVTDELTTYFLSYFRPLPPPLLPPSRLPATPSPPSFCRRMSRHPCARPNSPIRASNSGTALRVALLSSLARASPTAPRSRRLPLPAPSLPPTSFAPLLLSTASPSSSTPTTARKSTPRPATPPRERGRIPD